MGDGGLSGERLGRMHDVMAGHVENGRVPGLVTLVSRRGEVHAEAIGTKAFGDGGPMQRDTIFRITPGKLGRLATCYMPDPATGAFEVFDPGEGGQWSRPPVFPDGGAGLVSTADDYLAFARMLLNGGRLGSERILSRPAVAAMTTDQLTAEQRAGGWEDQGWGFGVSVVTRRTGVAASPGRYGWDGGYGTAWSSDPAEDLIGILMTQCAAFPPLSPVYLDFWTSTYQAIDD
jgi:CubicO group peptidase (beta-lactamase class C family)